MDREEAKLLMTDYVLGNLEATSAEAMELIVGSDHELRQCEEFLRWVIPRLMDMKEHFPGDHPTGQELVNAALGTDVFGGDREDWVREHLVACQECQKLQNQIAEADRQFISQDQSPTKSGRPWFKQAMAAIISLLLFSSGIWIGQRDNVDEPAALVHLAGITRGHTAQTEISLQADGRLPTLVLEFDPWVGRATADDYHLNVRLLERETRELALHEEISAGATWSAVEGGLVFLAEKRGLESGLFDLELCDDTGAIIFQTGFLLLPQ